MSNNEQLNLPENFNELKKDVNRAADWQARLNAVNELGKFNADETIKILQYVAKADLVTKVRDAAAQKLKKMGQKVPAYVAPKGDLVKDLGKVLVRTKKSLPSTHTFEDFKEKLAKMRSDLYNTYEGEEGKNFDAWLKEQWEATVTKR